MNEDLVDLCQVLETCRYARNAWRSRHELRPTSPSCRHDVHARIIRHWKYYISINTRRYLWWEILYRLQHGGVVLVDACYRTRGSHAKALVFCVPLHWLLPRFLIELGPAVPGLIGVSHWAGLYLPPTRARHIDHCGRSIALQALTIRIQINDKYKK